MLNSRMVNPSSAAGWNGEALVMGRGWGDGGEVESAMVFESPVHTTPAFAGDLSKDWSFERLASPEAAFSDGDCSLRNMFLSEKAILESGWKLPLFGISLSK